MQFLLFPLFLIKGRELERARAFEENPRTMRLKDVIYFAYKYYFKSPLLPEKDGILSHFKSPEKTGKIEFEILATVSIGGDLMPYEMIKSRYTQDLWTEIGNDFFGSDLVFANLESPLDEDQKNSFVPEVMLHNMHFNTNEKTFDIFNGMGKHKGYNILSIANNHTYDQGNAGIDKTINFLRRKGVKSVGAKLNEQDNDFEILEINGIKIGFLAFTYSLNEFLPENGQEWKVNYLPLNTPNCPINLLVKQVKACREAGAEFIVCSIHAGNAYQAYPSQVTIDLYQRVFEQTGVDVIAGGHPHNLQPWRNYQFKDPISGKNKQGFAIYSLGDFVAYDIFTWCHLCAYVKLEIGRNAEGELIFNSVVKPLLMLRENKHLRLVYAKAHFEKAKMSNELKDMKVLYDICVS